MSLEEMFLLAAVSTFLEEKHPPQKAEYSDGSLFFLVKPKTTHRHSTNRIHQTLRPEITYPRKAVK